MNSNFQVDESLLPKTKAVRVTVEFSVSVPIDMNPDVLCLENTCSELRFTNGRTRFSPNAFSTTYVEDEED